MLVVIPTKIDSYLLCIPHPATRSYQLPNTIVNNLQNMCNNRMYLTCNFLLTSSPSLFFLFNVSDTNLCLIDLGFCLFKYASGSTPIICASWNSFDLIKFRPSVAVTFDMTEVLSLSMVWYLGSGRSPVKRSIVTHNACAACKMQLRL